MPQGFGSSSLPPRAGVRGRGHGDREHAREDRRGNVQVAAGSLQELRHHHRADEGWVPEGLRPDGRHQH